MELCTSRAISNLPNPKMILASSGPHSNPSFFISTHNPGRGYYFKTSLRATSSKEKSTGSSQYIVEEPVTRNGDKPAEKSLSVGSETEEKEEYTEDTCTNEQTQVFEFLDNFDVKSILPNVPGKDDDTEMQEYSVLFVCFIVSAFQLDSGDAPSVLLLGGGSLIAFWIATVLVGAIDSIPLFPKLMEVVGLSYTLWFGTRYLLFKKNREELVVKIEEIKQQVLGSTGDN